MTSLRRFLVLQSLLMWQGGFLFYAAFVVPAGTDVLGSAAAQGTITARVTDALNACGAVALAVVCWDLGRACDPDRRRTAARWWCWSLAVVCQLALVVLHEILESFMDPGRTHVVVGSSFRPVHRAYLWVSTAQWLTCLALAWWTLRAWSAEDTDANQKSSGRITG
jgi:hypothetical protein